MRPDDAARVYVVDDDLDLGASVARLLRRHGFDATSFLDPAPLLDVHARAPAHCIVTDVMMGDLDGFTFADRVRERDAAVSIIFMTAWPTTANAVDSVRRYGGLDYLEKPLDEERLLAAVHEGAGWARERRRTLARTGAYAPRTTDFRTARPGTQQQGDRSVARSQPQDSRGSPGVNHGQDGRQWSGATDCIGPVRRRLALPNLLGPLIGERWPSDDERT